MFCSCIFLSALCSLGTIFLSILQCWQGRWGKNLKVVSFMLFVVCEEDVYGIKEPDFSSFFYSDYSKMTQSEQFCVTLRGRYILYTCI